MQKTLHIKITTSPDETIRHIEAITIGKVVSFSVMENILIAVIEYKEPEPEPEWEDYSCECKMCGGEWSLNEDGYCSFCWMVWNG